MLDIPIIAVYFLPSNIHAILMQNSGKKRYSLQSLFCLKTIYIGWLSQLLVWLKIKNVLLEQGWAFAAKAMLLQGVGRAFIAWPHLIFVISFTQTGFLKTKFYTQKND